MCDKVAVILAGGKGTRLRPYTIAMPKPLVPVGDKPILEIIIIELIKSGFKRIVITVNHQADIIMAYFGDGKKFGEDIKIEYSLEDKPLGTMGPLKLIQNLPDSFLVMNGDVLTDINFSDFLEEHKSSQNAFTIASYRRSHKIDYGVLEIENNQLVGFREKPETEYFVSMGIYALSKEVLQYIPDNEYYGFDSLMLRLMKEKIGVGVHEYRGYWMDIGRPDDYQQAIEDVEKEVFQY